MYCRVLIDNNLDGMQIQGVFVVFERLVIMERKFKGIWFPAELWLDDSFSWIEKMLLVEIDRWDTGNGCSKNNKYFADFLGFDETDVSNAIIILHHLGRIEIKYNDGVRYLKLLEGDE